MGLRRPAARGKPEGGWAAVGVRGGDLSGLQAAVLRAKSRASLASLSRPGRSHGHAKVSDLGLARIAAHESAVTAAVGTLDWCGAAGRLAGVGWACAALATPCLCMSEL